MIKTQNYLKQILIMNLVFTQDYVIYNPINYLLQEDAIERKKR